ncbi:DUF1707 domain-containing protein [Aeromicrobium sp. CTD01-1L150]|uniref:DUF1707 SHOCT-like domain-containing protein n=1 Tax=Aeromicrobium sp. CTD01-1L150 TaxID=3341830 RepID=UPI0035C18AF8
MAGGRELGRRDVWAGFSSDPRSPAAAELRANDADRDLVLEVLAAAYADGRLDRQEYDERCDVALELRRLGVVRDLISDLVALPAVRGSWQDVREEAAARHDREVRGARRGFVVVNVACIGIWCATALAIGPHFFWPVFPLVGMGIAWVATRVSKQSRLEDLEAQILQQRRRDRGQGQA